MKIILLAIRSLVRFRLYTIINILGLALSLACVIIISRYVYSEATTDHFNKKHEQLYLSLRHRGNGELPPVLCTTDNVLLKKNYINPLDIPEIEKRTSFVSLNDVEINIDEKKFNAHVLATDTLFLQLLDYPVLEGDRARLLADPKEAVITSRFAQKLFGKENPVGKNIEKRKYPDDQRDHGKDGNAKFSQLRPADIKRVAMAVASRKLLHDRSGFSRYQCHPDQ